MERNFGSEPEYAKQLMRDKLFNLFCFEVQYHNMDPIPAVIDAFQVGAPARVIACIAQNAHSPPNADGIEYHIGEFKRYDVVSFLDADRDFEWNFDQLCYGAWEFDELPLLIYVQSKLADDSALNDILWRPAEECMICTHEELIPVRILEVLLERSFFVNSQLEVIRDYLIERVREADYKKHVDNFEDRIIGICVILTERLGKEPFPEEEENTNSIDPFWERFQKVIWL